MCIACICVRGLGPDGSWKTAELYVWLSLWGTGLARSLLDSDFHQSITSKCQYMRLCYLYCICTKANGLNFDITSSTSILCLCQRRLWDLAAWQCDKLKSQVPFLILSKQKKNVVGHILALIHIAYNRGITSKKVIDNLRELWVVCLGAHTVNVKMAIFKCLLFNNF